MKRGFSLIEILAVLILVGIGGVFVGYLVSTSTRGYLLGREAAILSQQNTNAHQRLIKEINWAGAASLSSSGSTSLIWTSSHPDRVGEGSQSLQWSSTNGGQLTLNGAILLSPVAAFEVSLAPGGASVSFTIDGWEATVFPRTDP